MTEDPKIPECGSPPSVGAGLRPARADPPRRRSLRLQGYDYTASGAYFVTACVCDHRCLFGTIRNEETALNEFGRIVEDCWQELPAHFSNVVLDDFVVMPNHVHGLLFLKESSKKPTSLSEIVRAFKSFSARRINLSRGTPGQPIWQWGFYEHIVRTEKSLDEIRKYIVENPLRWEYAKQPTGKNSAADVRAGLRPAPTNDLGSNDGGNP